MPSPIWRITATTSYDGLEFTSDTFTKKLPSNLQKFSQHYFLHENTDEVLTKWNARIIESLDQLL